MNKNKYEFLKNEENQGRCIDCPWSAECNDNNSVCLVKAHQSNTQQPFTPYNGVTPFNKME